LKMKCGGKTSSETWVTHYHVLHFALVPRYNDDG
jgi:hypothetical protein